MYPAFFIHETILLTTEGTRINHELRTSSTTSSLPTVTRSDLNEIKSFFTI